MHSFVFLAPPAGNVIIASSCCVGENVIFVIIVAVKIFFFPLSAPAPPLLCSPSSLPRLPQHHFLPRHILPEAPDWVGRKTKRSPSCSRKKQMLTELERRQGEKERSEGWEGGRQMEGRVRGCQGNQTLPEQSSQLEGLSQPRWEKSHCFKWNKNGKSWWEKHAGREYKNVYLWALVITVTVKQKSRHVTELRCRHRGIVRCWIEQLLFQCLILMLTPVIVTGCLNRHEIRVRLAHANGKKKKYCGVCGTLELPGWLTGWEHEVTNLNISFEEIIKKKFCFWLDFCCSRTRLQSVFDSKERKEEEQLLGHTLTHSHTLTHTAVLEMFLPL